MKRAITRRRMLGRALKGAAGLGLLAAVPIIASRRKRIRIKGTGIRIRVRPLGADFGEGTHLAG
jgi:hypothetical protein